MATLDLGSLAAGRHGARRRLVHAARQDLAVASLPVPPGLPWQAWARAEPGAGPLLAVVTGTAGQVEAAAVVACHRETGSLKVGGNWGLSLGQRGRRPAEPCWAVIGSTAQGRHDAIRLLGKTIADLERPWRLHIAGLDSTAARLLADVVPGAEVHPADPVPVLDLHGWALAGSVRSQYDRATRRIAAQGLTEDVVVIGDPLNLLLIRDAIEAAHVARDQAAGRPCDLMNYPAARAFWHTAWNAAAAAGQLEVAVLLLDGELAAYCAAFTEPPFKRVFDSRMAARPATARYGPGRRTEVSVIRRAADDSEYQIVDWMLPDEAGLLAFTRKDPRWAVTAAAL